MSIVVIGTVFVDIKGYPFNKYIPYGRNEGKIETVHGGVARNVVEDIANMELRPTFVSIVDDSGTGDEVIEKLKKHKVNTDYIRKCPDGMGTWLAVFNHENDVVGSISKRPDLKPIAKIIEEQGDEIFENCDSVIVELDMDVEVIKQAFKFAKKYHKDVYGVISNMSIALERRAYLRELACFVCNEQEASMLFSEDYHTMPSEELAPSLAVKIKQAGMKKMVITLGSRGSVYASLDGDYGVIPPQKVDVRDTTGAGDSFCAGLSAGLTYGKSLREACLIGTRLASSVIITTDNVCPRFLPSEFGLNVNIPDLDE